MSDGSPSMHRNDDQTTRLKTTRLFSEERISILQILLILSNSLGRNL